MGVIIFRGAQCLAIFGEETPESVVRGRVALFDSLRGDRLGQWVFRDAELELRTGAMNCRDAARLAQVTSMASDGGCRGKVGRLDRRPDQREMEGGSEIGRRQFDQRKAPSLASKSQDGVTMHRGRRVALGGRL